MPKKPPLPPPLDVLRQIDQELTPRFLVEVTSWADRACGKLMAIEDRRDPHYAVEMVHAAVVDTCDGIRSWDPARVTLRRHLEQTINSRVWHECQRARRRHHVVFDDLTESQDESAIAVEMSLRHDDARARPDGGLAQRDVRERLFATLRTLAIGDGEVGALLGAYEGGDIRRDEAMTRLGWSLARFVNVRRRLETTLRRIPGELHDAAIEVLTRDGGAPVASAVRRSAGVVAGADADEIDADEIEDDDEDDGDDGEPYVAEEDRT